jgi:ketosteroid isomerase-like protein
VPNTAASDTAAHQAHEAYVTAINSNNLDSLLGVLTEDVVFLSAHEPVMVGKAAVRPWLEGYLKAYKTHWDKPVHEFIISGDWAFERYSYKSTDTPLDGGAVVEDTGWGLVIYHHDADGKWRRCLGTGSPTAGKVAAQRRIEPARADRDRAAHLQR